MIHGRTVSKNCMAVPIASPAIDVPCRRAASDEMNTAPLLERMSRIGHTSMSER